MELPENIVLRSDESDWLLKLGEQQGESRVMTARHADVQALATRFYPAREDYLSLPWQAEIEVRFYPGRVTVWSGPTFSGKTLFLRMMALHAIRNNQPVLFCSLEEEPLHVWREFVRMATLTREPASSQVQWCLDLWDGRLFIFDSQELIDPVRLLGLVRFLAQRHRIQHVVIDSLMRLNLRIDDYDGQRELGNFIGRVARPAGVHIHLVVHPRKTQNSRSPMDLYDIRGAQDIVAQADAVITLERKHEGDCDNVLTVWKQRGESDWIGSLRLWYDKPTRQLKCDRFAQPIRFLPPEAYPP